VCSFFRENYLCAPLSVLPRKQAMRDLVTAATLAISVGTELEQKQQRLSWKQVALNFWKQEAKDSTENNKVKPLHRKKVYEWLCATTHMLHVACGRGWEAFAQPANPDEREDAKSARSVTLCIDQGGDGWSAAHYLMSEQTNLLLLADQNHRTWNDVQLGIQDADMFYSCLITIVILNADGTVGRGPVVAGDALGCGGVSAGLGPGLPIVPGVR